MDCIFCKIAEKKIPSSIVYETDTVLAFKDIQPSAPTHILFIPKVHIERLDDIVGTNINLIADLYKGILDFTRKYSLREDGFKTHINVGKGGGQEVFHLHIHLLSKKKIENLVLL